MRRAELVVGPRGRDLQRDEVACLVLHHDFCPVLFFIFIFLVVVCCVNVGGRFGGDGGRTLESCAVKAGWRRVVRSWRVLLPARRPRLRHARHVWRTRPDDTTCDPHVEVQTGAQWEIYFVLYNHVNPKNLALVLFYSATMWFKKKKRCACNAVYNQTP